MKFQHVKECPKCGDSTNVINTRAPRPDGIIVRIRKCLDCGYMFEMAEVPLNNLLTMATESEKGVTLERENLALKSKVIRIKQFMKKEFKEA